MKKYILIMLSLAVGLLLAACSSENEPGTINQGIVSDFRPVAVQEAVTRYSQDHRLSEDEIKVVSYDQVDWPDACLGVPQPGQECADQVTPGYRIILEVDGDTHEFRSNETGTYIVRVTGSGEASDLTLTPVPEAIELRDCYTITFLDITDQGDGSSAWRYAVEEGTCGKI